MTPYDDDSGGIWRKLGVAAAMLAMFGAIGFFAYGTFANRPGDTLSGVDASVNAETSAAPSSAPSESRPTTTTIAAARPRTTSTTTVPDRPSTTPTPTTTTAAGKPSITLPGGSPAPVVAIFDVDTITLAGSVRSAEAAERLASLALVNSKTPATIINLLAIDPEVPDSIGVRVVELTSSRFPTGSAEVVGAHAAELDRIASIMDALPDVSALIIGHADQTGTDQHNQDLSEARAEAVVNHLEATGIAASRLSSRAVGESDLLSLNDDAASLALNRRTEVVLYGLLLGF